MPNLYRIYYENPVGRVANDPLGFARLTYYAGRRSQEAFFALLGHVANLMAQRQDGRLLIDQRLMQPFTPEEQSHVVQQWLPRLVQEGNYRFGAVVVAQNVFARLATSTVTAAVRELAITYQYFEQETEAASWLQRQQVTPRKL